MKLTLSLIKNFLSIDKAAKDIAHLLTEAGVEVDKIENETPSYTNIIAAKILEVEKHPSNAKLAIAKVFDGKDTYQVVCGAPNCRKDLIVAFAKIGASLKDISGNITKIKKMKIRDVESYGMLCSAKELNLSQEADKIIELDQDVNLGQDLSYLSCPVFDISLTPNLGHLLSAIGIARELASLTNTTIKMPKLDLQEDNKNSIETKIKIKIETAESLRYTSRIIENITIKPSPFWLKKELEACGFRSINNVIDATNYIMLKFSHPLHAFDYDKIENNKIIVAGLNENTSFLCLDKIKREIPKNSLIIKDGKKILAIAGIIGGLNSAISNNTKTVILEAAHFDPASIRKTSKFLNLKTESSMRFEKSIDPNMIPIAIDYAAALIKELTNGKILKGKIDIKKSEFRKKTLSLRIKRAQKILKTPLSVNEIISIFKRLEFNILETNEEAILLEIPTYRNDINQEIDLIEEIARIYGYNNLLKTTPFYRSSSITHSKLFLFEKNLRSYLRSCSLQEVKTCDLISPKLSKISYLDFEKENIIKVKHFKSIDQSILRPSLLPSLLEVVKFNHDHKNFDLSIYEIANIHFKNKNSCTERLTLSLMLTGKRNPHIWDKSNFDVSYYDLKGILENILKALLNKKFKFKASNHKIFFPLKQANIFSGSRNFAVIGEVHPTILNAFDIKKRVFFAEADLNFLIENQKTEMQYKEINNFPASQRDLTISLKEKDEIQKIFDIAEGICSPILEKVYILDIYKSSENKKNVTFRFIYRDKNKTISNDSVEKEHAKINKEIIKQLEK